ncbi:MAG: 16S rRNA (guanine(527)-N(7))-methyltransferase RsmG [Chloroflexi bacterium]|nr:16S rRNA (guanine(527)-N(7))-methyltransferase RsmG [Chloroflexota bacterium]
MDVTHDGALLFRWNVRCAFVISHSPLCYNATMDLEELAAEARRLGLELTPRQLEQFDDYVRALLDWNMRLNLTGITDPNEIMVKHLLDSLSVAPLLNAPFHARLIDIGTGAGFPGIVLKIALPQLDVTLLEATGKKVQFLKHILVSLQIHGAEAIQGRAEDLGRDPAHREQYDYAVARAVADLATLVEYALPFLRVGGVFVAQKGIDVEEEIRGGGRAIRLLGGHLRETLPVQLPGLQVRHLVIVDKAAPTPPAYPRRTGLPEHKPLR